MNDDNIFLLLAQNRSDGVGKNLQLELPMPRFGQVLQRLATTIDETRVGSVQATLGNATLPLTRVDNEGTPLPDTSQVDPTAVELEVRVYPNQTFGVIGWVFDHGLQAQPDMYTSPQVSFAFPSPQQAYPH